MTRASRSVFGLGLALSACAFTGACALRYGMAPIPSCGAGPANRMRWWGPSDPEGRAANEARCRTVGDPVVVPRPAPGFNAPVPGDSLAVYTWNVAVGAGDLLLFLRREVGLTCAGPASHPGSRFRHVVLLLQEAYRRSDDLPPMDDHALAGTPSYHIRAPEGDADVVETAALCGLAAVYLPSGRNGADRAGERRADKGNAVLSTLALDRVAAIETPFETERKVALVANVALPGGRPLRVVAVHLDVIASFRRVLLSGNQNRARQARGVLDALDSLEWREGATPPTLVGGDFNTWSGFEAALRLFRLDFPDSPPWGGKSTRGVFPTDHIFFRKGASPAREVTLLPDTYRRLDVRYGSDHEPLFVWLRLEGPAAIR
jgi:endonuclease/exonuclease/phosphatase family metal-dependent hydrolase